MRTLLAAVVGVALAACDRFPVEPTPTPDPTANLQQCSPAICDYTSSDAAKSTRRCYVDLAGERIVYTTLEYWRDERRCPR